MSHRNPVKGEVALVLGSEEQENRREFTLLLDFEAMLSIEENMGKPLPQVMAMAGEGFLSATAAIAQAAFARHHPDITRHEVLAMVMSEDRGPLAEALADAADAAFPKAEAGNAPAPKAKKPAGKRSGRSGAKSD